MSVQVRPQDAGRALSHQQGFGDGREPADAVLCPWVGQLDAGPHPVDAFLLGPSPDGDRPAVGRLEGDPLRQVEARVGVERDRRGGRPARVPERVEQRQPKRHLLAGLRGRRLPDHQDGGGAGARVDAGRVRDDPADAVAVGVDVQPDGRLALGITIDLGPARARAVDDLDGLAGFERPAADRERDQALAEGLRDELDPRRVGRGGGVAVVVRDPGLRGLPVPER